VQPPLYLVLLDRYHLGDDLFLNDLAQRLGQRPAGKPPLLFVHGSGEKVERTLESRGLFPTRTDAGVLDVTEAASVALVERAIREVNQDLVARLTDAVVSAVGVQGVDRHVLRLEAAEDSGADAEDLRVATGRVGWIEALVKQRVVPVVSALAEHPAERRAREVPAADAVAALARALPFDATAVVFTRTRRPGLMTGAAEGPPATAPLAALTDADVAEPAAVRRLVAHHGQPVLLTHLGGLLADDAPTGTRLLPGAPASDAAGDEAG
jgi:acetylglutamate kinase